MGTNGGGFLAAICNKCDAASGLAVAVWTSSRNETFSWISLFCEQGPLVMGYRALEKSVRVVEFHLQRISRL